MDNLRHLYDADALKCRFDSNQLLSTGCSLLSKRLLEPVHCVRCLFVTAVYNSVCLSDYHLIVYYSLQKRGEASLHVF